MRSVSSSTRLARSFECLAWNLPFRWEYCMKIIMRYLRTFFETSQETVVRSTHRSVNRDRNLSDFVDSWAAAVLWRRKKTQRLQGTQSRHSPSSSSYQSDPSISGFGCTILAPRCIRDCVVPVQHRKHLRQSLTHRSYGYSQRELVRPRKGQTFGGFKTLSGSLCHCHNWMPALILEWCYLWCVKVFRYFYLLFFILYYKCTMR